MDGSQWKSIQWNADKEEGMPVLNPVSLCRDRMSQRDTHLTGSFTLKQLDAVAPLSRSVVLSLRLRNPSAYTKRMVKLRIKAACKLKYRTQSNRRKRVIRN